VILDPANLPPSVMYRFMIRAIVPRPIAFVSTIGEDGSFNVAPFSFFCGLSGDPPLLGISINARRGAPKDSLRNLRASRDFVVNVVGEPLLEKMVMASGEWAADVDEFRLTGLTPVPSDLVRAPRVGECAISLECRVHREVELGTTTFVVGEIVRAHVADGVLTEGQVDIAKLRPIGRLGGDEYSIVRDVVHVPRPKVPPPDPR
jgi:flavin reductase (DIM6/NTAB) family NADH-FMN oxidoreductase RutF